MHAVTGKGSSRLFGKGRHVLVVKGRYICLLNHITRMLLKESERQPFGLCQGSARCGTSVLSSQTMLMAKVHQPINTVHVVGCL